MACTCAAERTLLNNSVCLVFATDLVLVLPPQGQSGNAVQYLTRNQTLKKLQLKLAEFRWAIPFAYGSAWG